MYYFDLKTDIRIFGKQFKIKKAKFLLLTDEFFYFNENKKDLRDFLKKLIKKYINTRAKTISKKMNLTYNYIRFKSQKTVWGSCSSKKNLNFNINLVFFPPEVIDYVIIHELSHLVFMNHSKGFWNLVQKYDKNYIKHRFFLKNIKLPIKL